MVRHGKTKFAYLPSNIGPYACVHAAECVYTLI